MTTSSSSVSGRKRFGDLNELEELDDDEEDNDIEVVATDEAADVDGDGIIKRKGISGLSPRTVTE